MSNKYTYRAPCTADELYSMYWERGMSQDEIAAELGTSQKVIWRAMRKAGINTRKQAKRDQSGSKNANWKGGRIHCGTGVKRDKGYVYIKDSDHPAATKSGYVAEHIKVALAAAGRTRLAPGEHVHHINTVKTDNRPENLAIGTGQQHGAWHASLQRAAAELLAVGKMHFDPVEGYTLRH